MWPQSGRALVTAITGRASVRSYRAEGTETMDKRTIYIIVAVVVVLAILGYGLGWFGGSPPPAATAPAPATPAPVTPAPAAPAQ
jgi:hypothetical protein